MFTCKDCGCFVKNPYNHDGKCEYDKEQHSYKQDRCSKFRRKLSDNELNILDIYNQEKISVLRVKNYGEEKKKLIEQLRKEGCLIGGGEGKGFYYVDKTRTLKIHPKIRPYVSESKEIEEKHEKNIIPIVCIDDKGGMLFNHRRVSRDAVLLEHIITMTKNSKLWIREFSRELFSDYNVLIDNDCIYAAGDNEFCFIEDVPLSDFMELFEKIIVCKWNRIYPSDTVLGIEPLSDKWSCKVIEEFQGSSHEKITIEEWRKL